MTVSLVTKIARPISSALSVALAMDNVGKLDSYGKLGAWYPSSLFTASEQGVVYDPRDLSTMFQDSAGTTPVTADGQPVGLVLDKSKGLVLGSELVTNGDFSNGATGWSLGSGWSISGGAAASAGSNQFQALSQTVATAAGKTYEVKMSVTFTSGSLLIRLGSGINKAEVSSGGEKIFSLVADGNEISFLSSAAGFEFVGSIDNISVRELAGNHALAPNSSSRPLKTSTGASQWTNYDAVDDVLNTTFPSALGSNCTIARANVGGAPTILTGQTIGTSYADSTDNAGLIIIDRALTGQETTDVTAWLTAKGATS